MRPAAPSYATVCRMCRAGNPPPSNGDGPSLRRGPARAAVDPIDEQWRLRDEKQAAENERRAAIWRRRMAELDRGGLL